MFSVKLSLYITVILLISKTQAKSIKEIRDEVDDLLRDIKTLETRDVVHHIEEQLSEEISVELQDMTRDEMVKVAGLLAAIHTPDKDKVTSYFKHVNSLSDDELKEHLSKILKEELDTELKALDNDKLNNLDHQLTADNGGRDLKLSSAALEDVASVLMGEQGKDFVHSSNTNDADHWKGLLNKLKPENKDGEKQGPQKRLISALIGTIVMTAASTLTSNSVNAMWDYWK